jgi:hypothetical protein
MENIYWNDQGRYQADYDRLYELVPAYGSADTVAGELIRACSRIAHDFYNNGMGNNTSGALNYLRHYRAINGHAHRTLHSYTTGRIYQGKYDGDSIQIAVEEIIDSTVKFIIDNPCLENLPNHIDMFDFEDEMDGSSYYEFEEDYEEA